MVFLWFSYVLIVLPWCPVINRLPGWPAASPGSLSRSARRPSAARTVAPPATPPGPWELGDVE